MNHYSNILRICQLNMALCIFTLTTTPTALALTFMTKVGCVGNVKILSDSDQNVYYSSWHYITVHILCSIPGFNTYDQIIRALNIPDDVAKEVLLFLTQSGLLIEKNGLFNLGQTQVHLTKYSPLIRQHHTNMRIASIQSLVNNKKTDLHYSTVSSMSIEDAEALRSEMLKWIEQYIATVKPSKEETLVSFNLDFFKMIK